MKAALIIAIVVIIGLVILLITLRNASVQKGQDLRTMVIEWNNIASGHPPSLYDQNKDVATVTFNTLTFDSNGLLVVPAA